MEVSAASHDFTKQFRRKLADGKTTDEALAELRAAGASVAACIIAVRTFRRCDIGEAKKVVHFSSAWADQREFQDHFHDELEQAAKVITDEDERPMDLEQLKSMSPEERHRKFPMGLGLFPQALPYLTQWRHLRWFLLFWLPNVISFLVLLPGHHRLAEHILLAVLSPFFLAIAFVSYRSGMASSNSGTFFRDREPLRFWLSTAVGALGYIALTGAYHLVRQAA